MTVLLVESTSIMNWCIISYPNACLNHWRNTKLTYCQNETEYCVLWGIYWLLKGWNVNQSHKFLVAIGSNRVFWGIGLSNGIIYHFYPSNATLRRQNSIWLMIMDNKLANFKSILTCHSSTHHRTEARRGRIALKHQSKQRQTQFELLFGQMSGYLWKHITLKQTFNQW